MAIKNVFSILILLFCSHWYASPILLFADSQSTPLSPGAPFLDLKAHSDSVLSVSYSPDGKTLLSGSRDRTLKLWDLTTGQELKTFRGHSSAVLSVSYTPDGKTLLSGSSDKTLKLWDLETGEELRTFQGYPSIVMSASYSHDGKTLLSGGGDKTLILWDLATGKELRTFQGHSSDVLSVSYSPDGKTLLSGAVDKTLILWDLTTSNALRTFRGHSSWVANVAYSPDGKTVLSGSADKTLKLWDLGTGQELRTFQGHSNAVSSVSYSPDGKTLLSGSYDRTLKLWDLGTGQELRSFQGHTREIKSVSFSPDGQTVASGSNDWTIKLWKLTGIPGLQPSVDIEAISFSENILEAGETAQLAITLKNTGLREAKDVSVNVSGTLPGLSYPTQTKLPAIPENGGTITAMVDFKGNVDLLTSEATIRFEVVVPNNKERIQAKQLKFKTREFRKPELILAKFAIIENQSSAPNNQIDLFEVVAAEFTIQNVGAGIGETVTVEVQNKQKGVIWLGVGENLESTQKIHPKLSSIASGKFETVTYYYFVNSELKEEELTFDVTVSESLGKFGFSETKTVTLKTDLEPEGAIRTVNVGLDQSDVKVVIRDTP